MKDSLNRPDRIMSLISSSNFCDARRPVEKIHCSDLGTVRQYAATNMATEVAEKLLVIVFNTWMLDMFYLLFPKRRGVRQRTCCLRLLN